MNNALFSVPVIALNFVLDYKFIVFCNISQNNCFMQSQSWLVQFYIVPLWLCYVWMCSTFVDSKRLYLQQIRLLYKSWFSNLLSVEIHCSTISVSLSSTELNFSYNKFFNEAEPGQNSQWWIMQFLLFTSQTSAMIISLYDVPNAVASNCAVWWMQQTHTFCVPENPGETHHFGFKGQNLEKLSFMLDFVHWRYTFPSLNLTTAVSDDTRFCVG